MIRAQGLCEYSGGGRGIRTPETLAGLAVFKTAAFNHSAIPPSAPQTSSRPDAAGGIGTAIADRFVSEGASTSLTMFLPRSTRSAAK